MTPRIHDRHHTGSYQVLLKSDRQTDDDDRQYEVEVLYIGDYAGGQPTLVYLDVEDEGGHPLSMRQVQAWFEHRLRGDFDVAELLAQAGYDAYGNPSGRPRDVLIAR